ncbi:MAG: NAD-dependent epimerase/dehydratase family protein [Chloroflexi bacterium]|nr:MAG: NAD-dependent epimerase/dehydratase family protein [Chloroflexota bacterium]
MNILIIGGTGIISTPITRMLIERGEQVTLFNRGNHPIPGARQVIGDRGDYLHFEQQMAEAGSFDCVIDMVAYHPDDAHRVTRAFKGRIGQYIFCSTVDVFTKPAPYYPIREGFPRSADPAFEYAYNKVLCEQVLEEASAAGDFPLTILRPAATYNDACAPISLLGSGTALLKRIRQGSPVIVLGDGNSFWASSHSYDVAVAFVNAVGNPRSVGKDYNVTGDEWMTWRNYFDTARKVLSAPPIQFVPIPAGLLARITHGAANWSDWNFKFNNIFDNTAAKTELGYRYTISWEEGVRRMVAYHDARGSINTASADPLYDRVIEVFLKHVESMEQELA